MHFSSIDSKRSPFIINENKIRHFNTKIINLITFELNRKHSTDAVRCEPLHSIF